MRKVTILLPLSYNDGSLVDQALLEEVFHELWLTFGGHSEAGTVKGSYKMRDGTKAVDRSLQIWVIIDDSRLQELKDYVAQLALKLDQESMFFEISDSMVEFIRPPHAKEKS